MDNNEIDKILKEKLKDSIKPSVELENKIRKKVEEEKFKKLKEIDEGSKESKYKYRKIKTLVSIAAVLLLTILIGTNLMDFGQNKITVAIIKSVEPTKVLSGILQSDSEFLIYAEETNVEAVRKSLYVEPALEYKIEKEGEDVYRLTFKQNIPDNTIVKLQYIKNKITEDSWAYQTSNKLTVTSTYPGNNEHHVSENTIIDINFSYGSVEKFIENVEISPAIDGKWEQLGKTWRFTPTKKLEEQEYKIKVNKGIKAENETLEEDYIFSFNVGKYYKNEKYSHFVTTIDEIENGKPQELLKIYYETDLYVDSISEISKIEIYKFKTSDEFIEYIQTKEYKDVESLGGYKFTKGENYLQLNQTLPIGYYVAIVKDQNNNELFNCPVQINNMSAYAIQTERDILAWVAEGEELAKNISVYYLDKEEKTNTEGIAEIKDILDGTESIKYLKIGNGENKLVVGVYNYNHNNYPRGYIYTDRPLYKNTDTIKVWGFVPRQLFYDEINENEFYIELQNEGKQQIKIDENGSFNCEIQLKNHIDSEYSNICLYYGNTTIANREVSIKNYELQNYMYNVIMDKNYGYEGEIFELQVKVEHITGLSVSNKSVEIRYDNKTYRENTDENGLAKFSIKLPMLNQQYTAPRYSEISVYNGDAIEYTNSETYIPIYVLKSSTYVEKNQSNVPQYGITLHKLAQNKNTIVNYNLQEIYEGFYNTNVEINLIENVTRRYIRGYRFNEYTKENEPIYSWETDAKNVNKIKTIPTQNGKIEFNTNEVKFKENTETLRYSYQIEFVYKDVENKEIKEVIYIDTHSEYENEKYGYTYFNEIYGCGLGNVPTGINLGGYDTYKYLLKKDIYEFSIGDKVKFTLAESTKTGIKDINNEGKILRVIVKENITQKDIIENNDFDYTFKEEDFPGCGITSAYFVDGKFYRMPVYYFDFNEQDRNIDVEIVADKEQYKPGDQVNITVKTTNKGKTIKSVVNISVVNKAIFEITKDRTDLLPNIYDNKFYSVYTYSADREYFTADIGGAGGGDGGVRGNFGDTACFQTIETDSKGIAKVSFTLPDNVTTYTVTAHSANKDLYLGVNKIDIVSKLDFFIQSIQPRNVKVTDDLVLNATAIAEQNYNVKYEFTINELNKTLTVEGNANSITTVNFGKIPFGTYHVTIKGQHEDYRDGIEYEINIIESAQEVKNKETIKIKETSTITPTKNPIVLEIYNEDMEKYLKYIAFIEKTLNERLDTQIAYNQVQEIKDKYYNTQNVTNYIRINDYTTQNGFKNLRNSEVDIVLTALISKYSNQYYNNLINMYGRSNSILSEDNIFEVYLLAAANNEPVLTDLLYLKEENDISNYNKLLVTLSLEFLGDYQSAKELYNNIQLTESEAKEYKDIIAIIDTFINKEEAVNKINELIEENPASEYLRFAILSFFENNSVEIEKSETVKIVSENINETVTINGMQVKTYIINNDELKTIKFETKSEDIVVSYYYQTLLDNIESENISKDIKISLNGDLRTGNTAKLSIEFDNEVEGEIRIALPNSLRLVSTDYDYKQYYLMTNQIDYVTFYKTKNCKKIEIPVIISTEGNYKFENVVCNYNGIYHISNTIDFEINK